MTSEQIMLKSVTLCLVLATLVGCSSTFRRPSKSPALAAPYDQRQVWAVVPLNNESGSLRADGVWAADHLARQLENARMLDVLPVSRVLQAMNTLEMGYVANAQQAERLRQLLQADAVVVGTITAYDPYDPPKLGLAVELYRGESPMTSAMDPRDLTRAATDEQTRSVYDSPSKAPVSGVSGFYDASNPDVRQRLEDYAQRHGDAKDDERTNTRLYRLNIDLYTEFVSYLVSSQLLEAERQRLAPPPPPEPAETDPAS